MDIQFSPPDISDLEIEYVTDALRSGWITTGPRTKELEKRIATGFEGRSSSALVLRRYVKSFISSLLAHTLQ